MEVEEMLAAIQTNHKAALDAMAEQVKALRETCELQQREIQQVREEKEAIAKQAAQDKELLERMLDDAQKANDELSATVRLLNHEMQMKTQENAMYGGREEPVRSNLHEPSHDDQFKSSTSMPRSRSRSRTQEFEASALATASALDAQEELGHMHMDSIPLYHSNATFPPRTTASAAPTTPTRMRERPRTSLPSPTYSDSAFTSSFSSFRIPERSKTLSPSTSQSTRRRRRESHGNTTSQSATVDTSMDLSYPLMWQPVPEIPSPIHSELDLFESKPAAVPVPAPVSIPAPSQVPRRHSESSKTSVLKSTHSSRLEKELQALRDKIKACSRS